jgi:transcriptional regulator with XRE-family HTH domain
MTTEPTVEQPDEDFAQLIVRIQDTHSVSQSEIARRLGITASAVSAWVTHKRGGGRGPSTATLHKLAAAFGIPEREVFDAARRTAPGPVSADVEARILGYFAELATEQQEIILIQVQALAEHNRRNGITR